MTTAPFNLRSITLALALASLCVAAPAAAQDATTSLQLEHFEPLPSQGTNILNTAKSDILGHLTPSAGLFLHYANDPLQLVDRDDPTIIRDRIIANSLKAELWGSIGLFDIGELGFVLPIIAFQNGGDLGLFGSAGSSISTFAVQDLRIVPKVQVLNPDKFAGFGVALLAPIYVPIGDTSSFASDGEVRVEPRLAVDWRHSVGLAIAANVAYQFRPEQTSQNIVSDDVLRLSLGFEAPTGLQGFQIIGSIFNTIQTTGDRSNTAAQAFGENLSSPAELLAGLQFSELPYNLIANVGAGAGITRGIGAPDFRVFGSIGYTPRVKDTDGDGIPDDTDACYEEPEDIDGFEDSNGCPDFDNDGDDILDAADGCPDEKEDVDTYNDEDGCPDPDNDQDKILDTDDKCPLEKEDEDGFEDEDGCPELDNDKDGIPDDKDKCPLKAETYNGNKDEDGCPDGKQTVVITETEIRINEKVYFASGKDAIQKRSFRLLNTVAVVLKQNPQVTKLRIEGHTDDVGKEESNLSLSKGRAAAVRDYLIKEGVGSARLESEGYGETKPVCEDIPELTKTKRDTRKNRKKIKACRATNRRVGFFILEVNGKTVNAGESVITKEKKIIEEPAP